MYQLISNKFPFWGGVVSLSSSLDDIFFDIMVRKIDFNLISRIASPEAADLCRNLLSRDPEYRLTAKAASEHPWLKS